MKKPFVSVIVVSLNSAKTLDQCLQSIVDQTYKDFELIVVDNFSTDNSVEIAKKYTDKVYVKGPERSAQMNYGVKKAMGEYVYKVDSDFVLEKEVLAQCVKKTKEGYEAVVVHNTPDVRVSWVARIRKFEVDMYKYDLSHSSARFVKKNLFQKITGFEQTVTAGEDYDFQNKLNRMGVKTGFVDAEALHLGEPKNMRQHMAKYYHYGKDGVNYKRVTSKQEFQTQMGFFRKVYLKNWRKFVEHPFQGLRFALYHTAKYIFGGLGYVAATWQQTKAYHLLMGTPRWRTISAFAAATVAFGLLSWFYMGPALGSCNAGIISGGPGDSTAGLTWLTWINADSPIPGFSHLVNAPFGESLRQPFQITSIFTIPTMWLLAQFTSAVCAWNLMVLLGYMSSALVMFAFIRWLTRSSWVAFFAGFAVTFVPFHQMNALGHLSYMFNAVFVLFAWAFIAFWRSPTWRRAALMALATAACIYVDGYFILLTGVLAGSVLLASLLGITVFAKKINAKLVLDRLKGLLLYAVFTMVCLLPIVAVQLKYASTISTALSSSRGAIMAEAQTYSARPYEYLLPADNIPFFPESYKLWRQSILHGSNFTESTLYLGFGVLVLAGVALVWWWRNRRQQVLLRGVPAQFIIGVFSFTAFIAFICSLAPKAELFGRPLPMPSWFIIQVTELWRVFSRLFVIVDMALVIVAAIGLYMLLRKWPRVRQAAVTIGIVLFLFLEFMTQSRAVQWSYSKSPDVYKWLATQSSVGTIAEYPLGEPPSQEISDYLTYQQISGKAMFNTSRSDSPQRYLHLSMTGLADPQTVPILRRLDVQLVLAHRTPVESPEQYGLALVRTDASHYNDDTVWTYRILPGPKAAYALVTSTGFHAPVTDKSWHSTIGMGTHGVLTLQQLTPGEEESVHVSLRASTTAKPQLLTFSQHGLTRWQGTVTADTEINFEADPDVPIDVIPYGSTDDRPITLASLRAGAYSE